MRLLTNILLSFAFCSGTLLFGASSTLLLGSASGARSQNVSLPLTFQTAGNQISALGWDLSYSTADFSAVSLSIGSSGTTASKNLTCSNPSAGRYSCVLYGLNRTLLADGVVATAVLTVSGTTANTSSPVSVSSSLSSTPNGTEGLVSGSTGTVTITQPGTVAGLTCAPASISPPASSSCNVTLTAAAPTGGTTVALGYVSSGATLSLPSSVLISAGTTQKSFNVQAVSASSSTTATITATLSGSSKTFSLGVTPETTPPTAPGSLSATAVSSSQINLSWAASTDNVGVSGYIVERCLGSACSNFAQIAAPTGTTYSNTGLASNTAYRYRVLAKDAAGNQSAYSVIATATTLSGVSVSVAPATASLSASQTTQLTATVTGSTNTAVTWTLSPAVGTVSSTGLYTAPATITTQQVITVTATSVADATKSDTAAVTLVPAGTADTTPPTAPGNVVATAISSSQITISWSASTDNVRVYEYRLERCQGSGCTTFVQITAPQASPYTNSGLTAGTLYRYRVRAMDPSGNFSPYSAIVSATTTTAGSGISSGRVAAYSLNAGTGTTVADSSGNGLTGTDQGATWTNTGKYGKALSFDGSSSYVDLGDPTLLQLTGSMTLSAWVWATAHPSDDGQIISKSSTSDGWQLKTSADTGTRTFGIRVSNGGTKVQRYSRTVPALNTWYHVAGVYNAAAGTLDIYVNGVLDNGVLLGTVPTQQTNSPSNVMIGKRAAGYLFQGTIDEVQVHNRALSQAEIQTLMNAALTP